MFEHTRERRRYIRSRADLEFQLARLTLALSRAPIARRSETQAWFEEACEGLIEKTAVEQREYVHDRVESIRATFFAEPNPGVPRYRPDIRSTVNWAPGSLRLQ